MINFPTKRGSSISILFSNHPCPTSILSITFFIVAFNYLTFIPYHIKSFLIIFSIFPYFVNHQYSVPTIYQWVSCTWILKKVSIFYSLTLGSMLRELSVLAIVSVQKCHNAPICGIFAKPANFILNFFTKNFINPSRLSSEAGSHSPFYQILLL